MRGVIIGPVDIHLGNVEFGVGLDVAPLKDQILLGMEFRTSRKFV